MIHESTKAVAEMKIRKKMFVFSLHPICWCKAGVLQLSVVRAVNPPSWRLKNCNNTPTGAGSSYGEFLGDRLGVYCYMSGTVPWLDNCVNGHFLYRCVLQVFRWRWNYPSQFIQWACLSIASLCEEFNEINEQGGSLLYYSSSPLSVWSSKERFCQPE